MEERFTIPLSTESSVDLISLDQLGIEIRVHSRSLAENIVTIGRKLLLVKQQLEHGQFGDWLKANTEFSSSTANNFMRTAQAVDETPMLAAFPHTKVLELLNIPAEERDDFVNEHDVDELSVRQLREAIKERDAAKEDAERQRAAAERNANFANQYSEKYYAAQEQLHQTQAQLESLSKPETIEIPVEVKPPDYDNLKAEHAEALRRIEEAESYASQKEEELREAQALVRRAKMAEANADEDTTNPYTIERITRAVGDFMGAAGMLPRMSAMLACLSNEQVMRYSVLFDTVEVWAQESRAALQGNGTKSVTAEVQIV